MFLGHDGGQGQAEGQYHGDAPGARLLLSLPWLAGDIVRRGLLCVMQLSSILSQGHGKICTRLRKWLCQLRHRSISVTSPYSV